MSITLTETAAKHVARHLAKRGKGVGLRLGVRTTRAAPVLPTSSSTPTTCEPEDLRFESHGVTVVVDPKSLPYLDGTRARFRARGLERGLQVQQPQRQGRVRLRREFQRLGACRIRENQSCGFPGAVDNHRIATRCLGALAFDPRLLAGAFRSKAPRGPLRRTARFPAVFSSAGPSPMIDFSRNYFELFGLPQRFRFDPAALDRAYRSAAERSASRPIRARGRRRAQRLALQSSARVNEAYRALQGSGRAGAISAVASRRRRVRRDRYRAAARVPRATARAARSGGRGASGATMSHAVASLARRRSRRRARRSSNALAHRLDAERACAAARDARARAHVPREARRRPRRDAGGISTTDGALPDLRAGRIARAARAPARGRHRPRHDEFARGDGAQRLSGRAARRRRASARFHRSCATPTAGVEVGYDGAGAAGGGSAEHDRLGQALDGARSHRSDRCAALSVPLRRRARHGATSRRARASRHRSKSRRKSCARCACAPRRASAAIVDGRGGHRARLFRRRAAPGDQGRGARSRDFRCCAC